MSAAWIITLLSIIGVVLNIHKQRVSFLIWMVTNFIWAIIDFYKGIPEQTFLFAVYFGLSVWGWIKWQPEEVKPL